MTTIEFEIYLRAECPDCGIDAAVTEISVDELLQPTFYYQCKCGHGFHKFRPRSLDSGELEKVIAFTKQHSGERGN